MSAWSTCFDATAGAKFDDRSLEHNLFRHRTVNQVLYYNFVWSKDKTAKKSTQESNKRKKQTQTNHKCYLMFRRFLT